MLRLFRELRRGSTKVLILSQLQRGPMYGYQIAKALRDRSRSYFRLSEGALYPALHALEKDGLVRGEWREVDRRSRKYYSLTPAGRKLLRRTRTEWEQFSVQLRNLIAPEGRQARAR